jgi:hypothetical protein
MGHALCTFGVVLAHADVCTDFVGSVHKFMGFYIVLVILLELVL